ncbi:MAG: hypothetical protein PHI28_00345 [Mangrovibacterium sp.]|nr:hypothetical protein [Mangrovibacterium sp.]
MQNLHLVLYLIFCFLIACQPEKIENLKFDDALYSKNLIGITGNLPKQAEKLEFAWYISSSPEGEWEKLSGIETDKIVLLTSYVSKYLKCTASYFVNGESFKASVVSSEPVKYKGNQNTDWFRDAGFGIMIHYLQLLMVGGWNGRWVEDGVQWFLFTYLGEQWAGKGQQFEIDSLVVSASTCDVTT